MPITTEVRSDGGVLVTVANTYINQTLHRDHLVPYEIWDLSKSDLSQISSSGGMVRAPRKKIEGTNPNTLVLLIANDDLKFGLVRMWQSWGGDDFYESRVFRTLFEAEAWLAALEPMPRTN